MAVIPVKWTLILTSSIKTLLVNINNNSNNSSRRVEQITQLMFWETQRIKMKYSNCKEKVGIIWMNSKMNDKAIYIFRFLLWLF